MKTFSPSLAPASSHTPKEAGPKDYRANRVFRHMTPAEVESLCGAIEHLSYDKGEMILQRHDTEGGVYLLLEGVLLANQYARSGREVGYRRIMPGSYFGEIAAIDGLPRSVNIVALEDARIARLPQSLVRRLFEESPRFMKALLEDMAGLARALTDRLFELTAVSVACRVDIELLRMASTASVCQNSMLKTVSHSSSPQCSRLTRIGSRRHQRNAASTGRPSHMLRARKLRAG